MCSDVSSCALLHLKMALPLLFVTYASLQSTEGKIWKPVKGDGDSGAMPGLQIPLGSFEWYPLECRRKVEETNLEGGRLKLRKKKGKFKRRVAGWRPGMFSDAELILDQWLKLLDVNGTCSFEVKECCSPGLKRFRRASRKHEGVIFQYDETLDSKLACKPQVSVPRGSWGSCAFVASGATLLRRTQGKFIDKHDTVIRLGHMPIVGWEEYTGMREEVLIGRGTIQSKFAQKKQKNLKFLIGRDSSSSELSAVQKLKPSDSTVVKPTWDHHQERHRSKLILGDPRVADIIYEISTKPLNGKRRGPSTGFTQVLRIILSQFCKEVDIFGLSPNCGGHYYNLESQMKMHHSCELESWVLHYIMKNSYEKLRVCVFV